MKADCGWSADARRVLLVRCGSVAQGQTPAPVVAQMQLPGQTVRGGTRPWNMAAVVAAALERPPPEAYPVLFQN